jgi:hypothetical protein
VDQTAQAIDALDGPGEVAHRGKGDRGVEIDSPVRSGLVNGTNIPIGRLSSRFV